MGEEKDQTTQVDSMYWYEFDSAFLGAVLRYREATKMPSRLPAAFWDELKARYADFVEDV